MFSIITHLLGYLVWYRHAGQPQVDRIPDMLLESMTSTTLQELTEVSQRIQITQMMIKGNIPPNLHEIAPHLKQLKLGETPHSDQLERLVVPYI
jgi:hypothetical protein